MIPRQRSGGQSGGAGHAGSKFTSVRRGGRPGAARQKGGCLTMVLLAGLVGAFLMVSACAASGAPAVQPSPPSEQYKVPGLDGWTVTTWCGTHGERLYAAYGGSGISLAVVGGNAGASCGPVK